MWQEWWFGQTVQKKKDTGLRRQEEEEGQQDIEQTGMTWQHTTTDDGLKQEAGTGAALAGWGTGEKKSWAHGHDFLAGMSLSVCQWS